jgi:hypothetical protein
MEMIISFLKNLNAILSLSKQHIAPEPLKVESNY